MDILTLMTLGGILLVALLIPAAEGLYKKTKYLLISTLALALAFGLRASLMNFESGDYTVFLTKWVDYFRTNGGFAGLKSSIGNYNLPYLYFLAAFSHSGVRDLYLIKLLSIAFDVVLAFGMMKLCGVFTRSAPKRLAAFLITLLLPTVVINGAMWGQCDSIYVAFAVLALWLVLSDRPAASMVCMALSFGFKLQAVFIMPLYLVLLFAKRVKFWHYFIFPLTYVIEILPAVIAGRPFMDAFTLYFSQANTVGSGLNYNSPSFYAMLSGNTNTAALSAIGVAFAFLFVFAIFILSWKKRRMLDNEALMWIALLFVVGIPFILPHMHDRYFFMADVLTLLPAVLCAAYVPMPILTSFASGICYYSYLKLEYLFPLKYGSLALIAVLLITTIALSSKLSSKRFDSYKFRLK